MADQASVNRLNARYNGNGFGPAGMVGSLAEFAHDATTLAELQAKLTLLDLKDSTQKAAVPAIVLAGAGIVSLAALPVLLFGVAELITFYGGLKLPWSLLLVSGLTIILAAIAGALAWSRFSKSFDAMRRSQEELVRNIAWIKTVLAHSGRFTPRVMR